MDLRIVVVVPGSMQWIVIWCLFFILCMLFVCVCVCVHVVFGVLVYVMCMWLCAGGVPLEFRLVGCVLYLCGVILICKLGVDRCVRA